MNVIGIVGQKGYGKSTVAAWLVRERGFRELCLADALKELALQIFPRTLTREMCFGPSEAREARFSSEQIARAVLELRAAQNFLRLDPDGRAIVDRLFGDAPRDKERDKPDYRAISETLFNALFPHDARMASPRRILQFMGTEWGRTLWDEVWLNAVRREVEANKSARFVVPDCRFDNEARYLRDRLGARVYWVEASQRVARPRDPHASEPERADIVHLCAGEIPNDGDLAALHARLAELFPA